MNGPAPIALVVEDEPQIRRFVCGALAEESCRTREAGSVAQGLALAAREHPQLVILDLGLPDRDGVAFIRELRSWSAVPVLVLSARTAEPDKIAALDAGADDYLTKPFGVGELRARIRAMLRRQQTLADAGALHRFGDVELDLSRHVITRAGAEVHLTPQEYSLLALLVTNPGRVLTQGFLMDKVWGPGHRADNHYLRVYMGRLRQKLEADPTRPRHLLTETGVGYRFQP